MAPLVSDNSRTTFLAATKLKPGMATLGSLGVPMVATKVRQTARVIGGELRTQVTVDWFNGSRTTVADRTLFLAMAR